MKTPRKKKPTFASGTAVVDDITPDNQAIYVPAIPPGFAKAAHNPKSTGWTRPFPKGITHSNFNFLDLANQDFFRIAYALTSAGLAVDQKEPCIISTRDRLRTKAIGDSGGFQIASGKWKTIDDKLRMKILRWQENLVDIAITLDVPTGPLIKGGYAYADFRACLDATLEHLKFYQTNRRSDTVVFLNVLQGNDQAQCDVWYEAVRKAFQGEGWAFAGPMRHDMYQFCRRILKMCDDNELASKRWCHVLGTSRIDVAVLLTAAQRAINEHVTSDFRISYDTSSPFRVIRWHQVYMQPVFQKIMSMPTTGFPNEKQTVGIDDVEWPFPSPLGDRMMLADFCVPKPKPTSKYYCDQQSYHYLAHHNLATVCRAIAEANRRFDVETLLKKRETGVIVAEAADAIAQDAKRRRTHKSQADLRALEDREERPVPRGRARLWRRDARSRRLKQVE